MIGSGGPGVAGLALALSALGAAPAAAGQETPATPEPLPGPAAAPPGQALTLWTGMAFSALTSFSGLEAQEVEGRKVFTLAARYTRPVLVRPGFRLEYLLDAFPAVCETDNILELDADLQPVRRGTTWGLGLSPLGARLVGRPRETLRPYLVVTGGFLYFSDPVPTPDATRFTFTGDVEAGGEYWFAPRRALTLSFRFHHISNAGTGDVNPGLNALSVNLGFVFGRGHEEAEE